MAGDRSTPVGALFGAASCRDPGCRQQLRAGRRRPAARRERYTPESSVQNRRPHRTACASSSSRSRAGTPASTCRSSTRTARLRTDIPSALRCLRLRRPGHPGAAMASLAGSPCCRSGTPSWTSSSTAPGSATRTSRSPRPAGADRRAGLQACRRAQLAKLVTEGGSGACSIQMYQTGSRHGDDWRLLPGAGRPLARAAGQRLRPGRCTAGGRALPRPDDRPRNGTKPGRPATGAGVRSRR